MNAANPAPQQSDSVEESSLAEILSVAAHELRQPATVIYGLAATLQAQRGSMAQDDVHDAIGRIEQQATRLVNLLEDLLDASRLQSGTLVLDLQPVDLAGAVEHAQSLAAPPAEKRLSVMIPTGLSVVADPAGLERVLVNLLTNAYRYGGPNVLVEARHTRDTVRLRVSDDGKGVPLNLVPHLFKPFRAEAGGTGLGLSIVLGLVEAFGGSIVYERSEPVGARFEVTLRVAPEVPRPEPAARYAADLRGPVTILVVDDEPDVLFLLRLTLEAAGYSVVEAAHGAEALETIQSTRPTLVITDLMMPVMDGRELIRRVRAEPETADLPIMLLSANPDQSVGADRVMRKPFNPRDLTRVIDELVGGAA
ncbi:MAG: hybrid sensor histidine kinase/response regulator [Actinomycetota bacterium]